DSAGLRPGDDYKREASFTTEVGKFRPDVLVYLPQQRHLIIDAKTSLNAYTRYVNAECDAEAQSALVQHYHAVADRIKELDEKRYEKLPGINSTEVGIMFNPVDAAFGAAGKHYPAIYQHSLEHNVLVAT
ncbi:DNA recombination protein RmuC, partial [Pseudoalteromonas sp. S407]|uniref:DNA recombination protein RmuC n=1 Tax=Pseudoalteromonas sp. S407 TaxID=2066520 RepID=UPI001108398A